MGKKKMRILPKIRIRISGTTVLLLIIIVMIFITWLAMRPGLLRISAAVGLVADIVTIALLIMLYVFGVKVKGA